MSAAPQSTSLPLPVAALLRRARNAKSPKERHDTAYHAWEASVRLGAAARLARGAGAAEAAALAAPSAGTWVALLEAEERPLEAAALLEAHRLFAAEVEGKPRAPQRTSARALLALLAGYRNRLIGHGAPRAAAFYEPAAEALVRGLEAAWAEGAFLPAGAALVYVESVEVDPSGARRARTLLLEGLGATLEGEGPIEDAVLPRRLYARAPGAPLAGLHPWVVFDADEVRERALFFNGRRRGAQLLDFLSGEALRGAPLEERFPGLDAEIGRAIEGSPGGGGPRADARPSGDERAAAEEADLFGDYRLLGELGAGGMGVVSLARQESLGRLVALKRLPPFAAKDPVARARFRREVDALSRCDHPHVVKILASGEARETPYYAMELIEGADLSEVARALDSSGGDIHAAVSSASDASRSRRAREGPQGGPPAPRPSPARPHLAKPEALAGVARERVRVLAGWMRDAARALDHVHSRGIVHRDVKPANLMITAADRRVVLMDLGLAAIGDASRSITVDRGGLLGTLRYTAPEQLTRSLTAVDRRADVYSLGATFYELLCGRPFHDGETEARLIQQVLREEPLAPERANPSLPRDLATIVRKCVEKDPARRYETAEALARDVEAMLDGRPIAARPPTLGYVLSLAARRNPALTALGAAVIAAAALGVVAYVRQGSRLLLMAEKAADTARASQAVAEKALESRDRSLRELQAQQARAEASAAESRHLLARMLVEKARRAIAERRHDAAEVLLARSLEIHDLPSTRELLVEARTRAPSLLWVSPSASYGPRVAATPSGLLVCAGGVGGRLTVLDPDSGREVASIRTGLEEVAALAIAPDGRRVLACAKDRRARILSLEPDGTLAAEDAAPPLLALSEPGVSLASVAPGGGSIAAWTPSGRLVRARVDAAGGTADLGAAPVAGVGAAALLGHLDERTIAVVGADGAARALDAASGAPRGEASLSDGLPVARAALSAGGRAALAIALDGGRPALRIVDLGAALDRAAAPRLDVPLEETPTALAWSPDGARVALGYGGGRVEVRSAEAGALLATVRADEGEPLAARRVVRAGGVPARPGASAAVRSLAFAGPGGARLAVCRDDRPLRVYDAATGALRSFASGHTRVACDAALSGDGRLVATSSLDGTIAVRDAATGALAALLDQGTPTAGIAISGRRLAAGGYDGAVRVWSLDPPALEARIPLGTSPVWAVAWDPAGTRLAAGCLGDGAASVLPVPSPGGAAAATPAAGSIALPRFATDARTVAWSPDGRRVVVGGTDLGLRVFDAASGATVVALRAPSDVNDALFSRDGASVIAGHLDERIRIWSLATGACEIIEAGAEPNDLALDAEGRTLAVACGDGRVRLYDVERRALQACIDSLGAGANGVAISADGRRITCAGSDGSARAFTLDSGPGWRAVRVRFAPYCHVVGEPGAARLLDAHGRRHVVDLETGRVERGAVAPGLAPYEWSDGDGPAIFLREGPPSWTSVLVDRDGVETPVTTTDAEPPAIALSRDGRRAATFTSDGFALLWESGRAGPPVRVDVGGRVTVARYSSDGARIYFGRGMVLDALDVGSLAIRRDLYAASHLIADIASSPDDRLVLVTASDETPVLLDAATAAVVASFRGPSVFFGGLTWSPDGKRFTSACADDCVRLYEAAHPEREPLALRGLGGTAASGGFLEGGRLVYACGSDHVLHLVRTEALEHLREAPPATLAAEARARLGMAVLGTDAVAAPRGRLLAPGEE